MSNLVQAMRASSNEGIALKLPFFGLDRAGVKFRRGQVSLVAAASGGGKSAFATHISVHSDPPIPTLYFSADTDKTTLGVRIAAGVLGCTLVEAEERLREGEAAAWQALSARTENIRFSFESVISQFDFEEELEAYQYATGAWPHLIVLDNLINIDYEGDSSHVQKDAVMHWLQQLANISNSHILVLHHVTGAYEDGLIPIPKSGLLDKVAKRPRLVLTLYRPQEDLMGVCVVKNSSGPASADGSLQVQLAWRAEKSYLRG